jgi:hypothetical protein
LPITAELTKSHIEFRKSQNGRGFTATARTAGNMREINFGACRPDQVAFETQGAGDFTTRAVPILKAGQVQLTNDSFRNLVIQAFGAGARQEPTLDCSDGSLSLPLFGFGDGSTSAPANGSGPDFSERLSRLESRVAGLGR